MAANAWAYFQPNVGVDASLGFLTLKAQFLYGFTDWDLGVYIQAAIDAQKLGLIGSGNSW